MRVFIAVDFNDEIKRKLAEIQAGLRKYTVSGRWKHIGNFHLTLKFLGEIDTKAERLIGERLVKVSSGRQTFRLEFSNLGYFPGRENIRVLWLGLEGDMGDLHNLYEKIDAEMAGIGFKPEKRKYTPHITLGQDLMLKEEFESLRRRVNISDIPKLTVDKITLFKSEQIGKRRVYTVLNDYRFSK
jgi:2'-5' RNA ligase